MMKTIGLAAGAVALSAVAGCLCVSGDMTVNEGGCGCAKPKGCACAQPAVSPGDERDFVRLFNGKDLDDWSDMKHVYRAEDGMIVFPGGEGVFGNLFYKRPFTNFVARFEFRMKYHGNNGFGVRAGQECFDGGALVGGYRAERDAAYNGMEIQILDNVCGRDRNLKSWQFHGSIYGVVAAQHGAAKPLGEWNEEEVTVDGDNVTVVLNGKTILACSIEHIEKTPDGLPHPGLHNKSGYIGFLGHTEPTWIRNVRIRELP